MIRPISKAVAIKTYATAVDTDFVADSGTIFSPEAGRPTEWIVVGTAGDLVLKTSRGTQDVVTLAAGVPVYIEATKMIAAGSTAAKITAGW